MFSLCRFYELTGRYPEMITVVSYDFKEARFSDVHRAALVRFVMVEHWFALFYVAQSPCVLLGRCVV